MDKLYENLAISNTNINKFEFVQQPLPLNANPWHNDKTYLKGILIDSKTGKQITIQLVTMGNTVLRRVTFPIQK